jgi:hypothetical protein
MQACMTEAPPRTPPPGSRRWARLCAIAGPALVLGLAIQWFGQPPEKQLSEDAIATETALQEAPPGVVLLGNSMTRRGVDANQLSKALGVPVSNLAVNGTSARIWYLVLKNRVFANGHKPHAVIVLGAARTLLAAEPLSGIENVHAAGHREPIEPVIDAKVHGDSPMPIEWLWATWKRDLLRTNILDGIRRTAVEWFFSAEVSDAGIDADTWAKAQLDTVFGGEDNLISVTAARVIPVVEVGETTQEKTSLTIDETFMPDLVALAQEHGTRLMFVRMPVAPSGPTITYPQLLELSDAPVEHLWKHALTWLSDQDAGYVDLRNMRLDDADFVDFLHANKHGRRKITQQLGEQLKRIDLMGDEPLPRVVNLSPTPLKRSGSLPKVGQLQLDRAKRKDKDCRWEIPTDSALSLAAGPLAKLGIANASPIEVRMNKRLIPQSVKLHDVTASPCSETAFVGKKTTIFDAAKPGPIPEDLSVQIATEFPATGMDGSPNHWLFPGQSLSTTFPTAWPEAAGDFQVSVSAVQLQEGPALQIAVDQSDFESHVVGGHSVEATLTPPAPAQGWTLRLSVPEEGSPTLIQSLGIGAGFSATWLIGQPNSVASHRAVGNKRSTVSFETPPPVIDLGKPTESEDGLVVFKNTEIAFLGDDHTFQVSGLWACSPVELTFDGEATGRGHRRCKTLPTLPQGSYCHTKSTIRLKPTTDNHPMQMADRWGARLDPDRKCSTSRWLFPGDVMTANPWRKDTLSMTRGIRSIDIAGVLMDPIQGKKALALLDPEQFIATVTVHHNGEVLLSHTLTRAELNGETQQFAVVPPVFPTEEPVFFVVESDPSAPYVVLSSAAVSEQAVQPTVAVKE